MRTKETMDGNKAAALAAYPFTEVASIYPITPSTPIAEQIDEWATGGKPNLFGRPVRVVEMQSEAGAAAAMRGALQSGALASTYTASQGLLLMIPSLYKMAGELLPGVLHVTARAVAAQALSIFGDHQDVMACRQTGVLMFASSNVQEVYDLGTAAHLCAIEARLPVLHFFDGFRTSHEYRRIETLQSEDLASLIDTGALQAFRSRALNPEHPVVRGTAQNPDIYFQQRESANRFYRDAVGIFLNCLARYGDLTGRHYAPYEYYGSPDAERIVVSMGSVCETADETVDYLRAAGERVGAVRVHLYRPFAEELLLGVIPETVRKIAVLDRTKEPGAPGEPLYLDVVKALRDRRDVTVVGGRYGLSSKDTRPSQIIAVFRNLEQSVPKDRFTLGITDDVTFTSLPEGEDVDTTPEGTVSCRVFGLGSDGTVGSNKTAVRIIGDHTDLHVQGYFSYDSKKSGGTTVSHLRFGPSPLRCPYLVRRADYIACHNSSFVNHYDLARGLKKGGTFVLACSWSAAELDEKLPPLLKRSLAAAGASFHIINAMRIAADAGLGNRINMIMQAVFFRLSGVLPYEVALQYLRQAIEKLYGKKGEDIVRMNLAAVDLAVSSLQHVTIPEAWAALPEEPPEKTDLPDFVTRIQMPMARHEGDELPVSAFAGMEDGTFPSGTTAYEKRGIAPFIPQWQPDRCIQCGQCAFICPHATIRGFLADPEEAARRPAGFITKKAAGKDLESYEYRIQVSPQDCTGCGNCAEICPAKEKALLMMPAEQETKAQSANWEFAMSLRQKPAAVSRPTVRSCQFLVPRMEFNGACPGCGETPYIRLLTQLFGERMIISNATGCSSIWGASAPSVAYSTDAGGRGPAWINPLFEDAAEFALGLRHGISQVRAQLIEAAERAAASEIPGDIRSAIRRWLDTCEDGEQSAQSSKELLTLLSVSGTNHDEVTRLFLDHADHLVKKSVWAVGGDGWAYDIGYGGLDHVLASGEDVNLFVLDTEIYSNTGGQCSKSTPAAAVAKLASAGKRQDKKNLGLMAMTYGMVYVAQIAMGADMNQTLKALTEAESYRGPSLIIAYSPCISHGIKNGMGKSIAEEKKAVQAGYFHLFRYHPALRAEGKNPFVLDSPAPTGDFREFIHGEIRYTQLQNVYPDAALKLQESAKLYADRRYELYKNLAERGLF